MLIQMWEFCVKFCSKNDRLKKSFSDNCDNKVKVLVSLISMVVTGTLLVRLPNGGILLPVLILTLAILRGLACVSPCKILAKSDDYLPSYTNSSNSRWPLFSILHFRGKRIWTIPHVAGPHYLCTHQSWWRYFDIPSKRNLKNAPYSGILLPGLRLTPSLVRDLCVYYANFQLNRTIGCRVVLILLFYPLEPILGASFPLPLFGGSGPRLTQCSMNSLGVFTPNSILICSVVFAQLRWAAWQTDWQTDAVHIHVVCISCIWCSYKVMSSLSHISNGAALISVSVAFSQSPVYTARPWNGIG